MKKLTFKNGNELQLADNSAINDFRIVLTNFAEIDDIVKDFTIDNLNGGTFDGAVIEDMIPTVVTAMKEDDNIEVHFLSRAKTKDEVLQEKIDEVNAIIAELKGQDETQDEAQVEGE